MKSKLKKSYIRFLEYKVNIYNLSWYFAPLLWRLLIKVKVKSTKNSYPNLESGEEIILLVSDNYSISPYEVQGADLTKTAKNWIEDLFELQTTRISTFYIARSKKRSVLLITYDWLSSFVDSKNILQVIFGALRVAIILKKNYKHTWVVLPDSYYLKVNLLVKILEIVSSNLSIFVLQNTRRELMSYGFKNIISPAFWTWPKNQQETWATNDEWHQRDRKVLIAASGGCKKRLLFGKKYIAIFQKQKYKIIETNFSLSWNDYVKEVKSARYIFTTCYLQEAYITNSEAYNSRISKYTVTGRALEALYAGAVLLTNNNKILNEMGFFPNVHFIDIDELELANIQQSHIENLFNENTASKIARNGKKQFEYLLSNKSIYALNNLLFENK